MVPQTPLEKLKIILLLRYIGLRIRKTRLEFGFFLLATSWPRSHSLASYILVSSNRWEAQCLPHRLLKESFEEKAVWKYPSHGYGCTKDPNLFSWLSIHPCDKNWHFEQYCREIFSHTINQGKKSSPTLLSKKPQRSLSCTAINFRENSSGSYHLIHLCCFVCEVNLNFVFILTASLDY